MRRLPQARPIATVDLGVKSGLEVAQRAYRIAEAELLRGRQLAFTSPDDKAQLAELIAQVELRRAEMNFSEDQLSRATVNAPNGGLIILDDPASGKDDRLSLVNKL